VLEEIAAIVVLTGLVMYAVFGGADFGGGIWTAFAWGPRRAQQREALYKAIGPVWETNNVWLVGAVVFLFTMFPHAFANLFVALLVPITVGLVGLVFRGAAFAYRNFAKESADRYVPLHGMVFSAMSAISPFFFALALGATASGDISVDGGFVTSNLWDPWLGVFPILFGLTAVAICAYLTMNYMTTRASGSLREDFRRQGLVAGVAVAALAIATLGVSYWDARDFWDLWQRPVPLAMSGATLVAGVASLFVLWRRWWMLAPLAAGGAMAMLAGAWGVIQFPYFIVPSQQLYDAAASSTMLKSSLVGLAAGAVILIPSLLLLYLSFVSESTEETPPAEA